MTERGCGDEIFEMLNVQELRQSRAALVEALQKLHDETVEKGPSHEEEARMRTMEKDIITLEDIIHREEALYQREAELAKRADHNGGLQQTKFRSFSRGGAGNGEYETADQSDLISRDQSFEKHLRNRGKIHDRPEFEKLTVGGVMRSLVTGPRTAEEKRALAEGADSTGGVSVPDLTLARFIDRLRAATVCFQAGAQTLPLTSDKNTIARTITDPTCAWRAEAGPIAESDPAFEGLVFVPRSLAVHFKVSRELLEDSVNIEQALEASLRGALSVELDRVALEGTGTPPEPKGISPTTNVGAVAVTAALTSYDKILDGIYEILVDNAAMPTSMVMHPRTAIALAKLKEGVASSINPVRVPALVEPIKQYMTTGISITLSPGTATTLYLGDFTQLIFGIRTELRIEVLRELFAVNHQYGFVAHMRADIGLQHPQSFCKLTGIVP
jgi:HK97 family phage major capsid protein